MGRDPEQPGECAAEQGIRTAGEAGTKLLSEAAAAYRAALDVYTRESLPQQWAMTQNNLGAALQERGIRTTSEAGARLLSEAVAAYRAALDVYTRESLPQQWAMTQNNLGAALKEQGIRTAGEASARLVSEAVAAYRAALEVYTRESLPQQWAMTQNNLANTLQEQGIRTAGEAGARLLSEAVAAYRAALEVRTRESLPQQWAMTQNNLARGYIALEDWPQAAAGYAELLHANFDDGEAYQKANWLYHEKLSDFGTAFALNQQWLERHPEDLFAQGDFAERHFTTGRFVEAKERLAALLANPQLDPRVRITLQALEIATLLALNDPQGGPATVGTLTRRGAEPAAGFPARSGLRGQQTLHRHGPASGPAPGVVADIVHGPGSSGSRRDPGGAGRCAGEADSA